MDTQPIRFPQQEGEIVRVTITEAGKTVYLAALDWRMDDQYETEGTLGIELPAYYLDTFIDLLRMDGVHEFEYAISHPGSREIDEAYSLWFTHNGQRKIIRALPFIYGNLPDLPEDNTV